MEVTVTDEYGLSSHDFVEGQYDIIRFSRVIAQYAKTNSLLVRQIHGLNREVFTLKSELEKVKCRES